MEMIWLFFKGHYKVHCRNRSHARQIGFWSGCVRDAVYFYPDGHIEEDVIIPSSRLSKARELVGIASGHKICSDSDSVRNMAKPPILKDNDLQEAKNGISPAERRS